MPTLKYFPFFIFLLFIGCKAPSSNAQNDNKEGMNHLADQSSPYLLQHARNPVDWYPWGEEALQKAKAENKLLIISVGYSACHWCHVMEHESFEDTLVSKIMNEHFVNIKVDREERPDIDDVYMTACHLISKRSCGWPLNAFALPDGRPIWAGTYFPKDQWMKILNQFVELNQSEPDKLALEADRLTQGIGSRENILINGSDQNFEAGALDNITANFLSNIDMKEGGKRGAPKFPMPNNYEYLLQQYQKTGKQQVLDAVTITLDKMAMGGIYDHVGGGFARYSVDGIWHVPHFEKMMYDNGQLVSLYAHAYQITKNPLYKSVIEETTDYVKREMTNKQGGFYSSLDADSEGVEGKFYVWRKEEIDQVLGDEERSKIFNDYYEIKKSGNWEHGNNILNRKKSKEEIAKKHNISLADLDALLLDGKKKLLTEREKRVRPGLDDKILTSWNALMLKGYVDAYRALGDESYLQAALANARFLDSNMMQKDFRLNRNYKDGKSVINAFLDDYALLADAYIGLYQITFDEQWLNKAKGLVDYTIVHFFDKESGMFNYTSDIDPPLIVRKKELSDNVIPASNSALARSIYKLGLYFYDQDKLAMAKQMMHNMSQDITTTPQPNYYSNWCQLYHEIVYPPYEVAIVGNDYATLQGQLIAEYTPHAIFLGGKNEGNLELLKDKLQDGETMIYVCQNKVCKLPVTDAKSAQKLMN